MRRRAATLVTAAGLWLLSLPALALDLGELMRLLATQRSGEASFSEQRFVRGLDAPLAASGTLSFAAPDRFARHTLTPRAESMTVDGNVLTLVRGTRTRSLRLDSTPELMGLIEAVRGTLTGNAAVLTQHFHPLVSGSPAAWTLDLTPLSEATLASVRKLRIVGEQAELRRIEMELADGDRSVMSIGPLRAPISPLAPASPATAGAPAS